MAYLLHLTFHPTADPRIEGWSFRVDHTGHRGWMGGDLPMAARGALAFAQVGRRSRGVMLNLPRAGLLGLCSRRFVIREPGDVAALRSVDVVRLRARHRAAARRGVVMTRARVAVLRAWGMLRMPPGLGLRCRSAEPRAAYRPEGLGICSCLQMASTVPNLIS